MSTKTARPPLSSLVLFVPIAALALSWASAGNAEQRIGPQGMRLMSANIRFAGDDDPGWRWRDRRDVLVDLIGSSQPDVLGTQEGWAHQVEELADGLPSLSRTDTERAWATGRMYPTLFYRHGRFDLIRAGDSWLSDTPDVPDSRFALSLYPRTMTWAEIRHRASGRVLFVANVHLTHLLPWVRQAQARVAADQIRRLNVGGHPTILLGDFNERPTGETRAVLRGALPTLFDPFGDADRPAEATYNGFGGWLAGGRIDWILIDRVFRPSAWQVVRWRGDPAAGNPVFASDHDPVVVTVDWPTESSPPGGGTDAYEAIVASASAP